MTKHRVTLFLLVFCRGQLRLAVLAEPVYCSLNKAHRVLQFQLVSFLVVLWKRKSWKGKNGNLSRNNVASQVEIYFTFCFNPFFFFFSFLPIAFLDLFISRERFNELLLLSSSWVNRLCLCLCL